MWNRVTLWIILDDLTEIINHPYLFQNSFSENKWEMSWKIYMRCIQIYANVYNMIRWQASHLPTKTLTNRYRCFYYNKKLHTAENDQELINIFEHKIYSFYIHLWLTYHRPSHFIINGWSCWSCSLVLVLLNCPYHRLSIWNTPVDWW